MAGHSKWANIRHRKAAQDSKRGKLFTRLIRELSSAAQLGDEHPRLRTAVEKAMAANMPRDTIDRAIQRAKGKAAGELQEVLYEGRAGGGVALLVEALTDNRNRSAAAVRHLFASAGGRLEGEGAVGYLFRQEGRLLYVPEEERREELVLAAMDTAARDVLSDAEDDVVVSTDPGDLEEVRSALEAAGWLPEESTLVRTPSSWATPSPEEVSRVAQLLAELRELEDVQEVYCNARLPGEGAA